MQEIIDICAQTAERNSTRAPGYLNIIASTKKDGVQKKTSELLTSVSVDFVAFASKILKRNAATIVLSNSNPIQNCLNAVFVHWKCQKTRITSTCQSIATLNGIAKFVTSNCRMNGHINYTIQFIQVFIIHLH